MKTTLITGGAGFIGSHLAEYLLARGDRLLILDDLSTGRLDNLPDPRTHDIELINKSVLDISALTPLVESADRVFHLAAAVGVKRLAADSVNAIETNVLGTLAVLRACARYRRAVLVVSSSEVYGKSRRIPFAEADEIVLDPAPSPRSGYACSKAIGEYLASAYFRNQGLPIITARLFNTAGPRQTGRYGMVIPRFIEQALAGRPITVYGDGSQRRCFCHVLDIVAALATLMDTPRAYGETINLGGQELVDILQLARLVKNLSGSNSTIVQTPFEQAYGADLEDMRVRKPDIAKARALIGFTPSRNLHDILSDTIAYWQSSWATEESDFPAEICHSGNMS